jgi:hypothetical protein
MNLIKSVLGNVFLGYEGTPWHLWGFTGMVSMFLFFLFGVALLPKVNRKQTVPLYLMVFIPLVLVIGFSLIKPIFVNRYLMTVTIAEILLISFAIKSIPNEIIQKITAIIFCIGILWFNCWYPTQHKKTDIRKVFDEINLIQKQNDFIVASDAIIFLETLYYAKDKTRVRLYNPNNQVFPWYIGDAVYSSSYQLSSLPYFPNRAFFIESNGEYSVQYNISNTYKSVK